MNGLLDNRKGTTLIEILVVMLILLIGIMIVVQMFPTGFRVVLAAENQTIATKLAQAEIERWKNMPGNLPDGILPLKSGNIGQLDPLNDVLNDEYPGPPFEGFIDSGTDEFYNPGNSLNCRYVRNETTTIPVGSFFTTGSGAAYGSRYTLAFSPIEVHPDPKNAKLFVGLSVKSGDLARRTGDSTEYINLRIGQYGIDYELDNGSFHVAFPWSTVKHTYYISYSYWIQNTTTKENVFLSKVDQPVESDPSGGWVEVPVSVATDYPGYEVTEVEPRTDSCARAFEQVVSNTGWSDNPYEFALADQILGIIAFNPRAKNMTEITARGKRAITARIDYRIYDPRIIREDKVVGAPNEHREYTDSAAGNNSMRIKLALRFILYAGMPDAIHDGDPTDNPDEPTFEGLVRVQLGQVVATPSQLIVKQSMLIIDLASGLRIDMTNVKMDQTDRNNGVVHLPTSVNLLDWNSEIQFNDVPLKGRHLRFFYRADGDWSVQCQKAYTYYLRKYDNSRADYCHFKYIPATNQILFALCDTGKTVSVSYNYTVNGVTHSVVGRPYKIIDDWKKGASLAMPGYIDLDAPPESTVSRLLVVGTSLRARVVWRDGKQWRFVDMDTVLTRNSTP